MNMDQLNYLVDIARTNSITATAGHFYVTQQAVSDSIKRLEKELECTILLRKNKGVEFTDVGQRVLSYAMQQTNQLQLLKQEIALMENPNNISGRLRIGVTPMAATVILSNLFRELSRSYPHIRPTMQEYPTEALPFLIEEQRLDFALMGSYTTSPSHHFFQNISGKLQFLKIYADELVCVMAPNNPLARQQFFSISDFDTIPRTMYSIYSQTSVDNDELLLHVSNQTEIHQFFMREKNTVCLIPYHSFLNLFAPNGFVFRPIINADQVLNYLVWRTPEDEETSALYEAFIHTLVKVASSPELNFFHP